MGSHSHQAACGMTFCCGTELIMLAALPSDSNVDEEEPSSVAAAATADTAARRDRSKDAAACLEGGIMGEMEVEEELSFVVGTTPSFLAVVDGGGDDDRRCRRELSSPPSWLRSEDRRRCRNVSVEAIGGDLALSWTTSTTRRKSPPPVVDESSSQEVLVVDTTRSTRTCSCRN